MVFGKKSKKEVFDRKKPSPALPTPPAEPEGIPVDDNELDSQLREVLEEMALPAANVELIMQKSRVEKWCVDDPWRPSPVAHELPPPSPRHALSWAAHDVCHPKKALSAGESASPFSPIFLDSPPSHTNAPTGSLSR